MSEILQEHLRNIIRTKEDINIEKFRTVSKSHFETQWKNKKYVWDKNSVLAVDGIAIILLENKKLFRFNSNKLCF